MKLYYLKDHYDSKYRRHLFPLLKPFVKPESFTDAERISAYGVSEKDFQIVDSIAKTDVVILTMSWWYYHITNKIEKAITFIKEVNHQGFPCVVEIPGDNGIDIPKELDVWVVRAQDYRSKLKPNHFCMPVLIEDPLKKYYNTLSITERTYSSQPVIGFCGQANKSKKEALKDIVKTIIKNVLYTLNYRAQTKHAVMSAKYIRAKLVFSFLKDKRVKSNFIIREKYRAGVSAQEHKSKHKTTLEFFDNIMSSDYVLCFRGAGNFSVRLYETLAMGRIPVFVDSDCILPYDDSIDWRDYVVWVDYKDRNNVVDKVLEFHSRMTPPKLNAQFKKNRDFWESKLQLKPYFQHYLKKLLR